MDLEGKPKSESQRQQEVSPDFSTTNWSVVLLAGLGNDHQAAAALERLCQRYWYPAYAFIRRRGASVHEAEDLTQSFFAYLLEKETLKKANRDRGKFRSFLLTSLTNFVTNDWNKRHCLKRDGAHQLISLDAVATEELYRHELIDSMSPEKLFERRWALTLVRLALARLKKEYETTGKTKVFRELESGLTGEVPTQQILSWMEKLQMNENAVRVALHRMRRRFGQLLRSEVAHTVATAAEVDEEIRHLFAAIAPEV
jgi:DNA-directed RNA polymerase specialized sigma24 family protein